MSADKELMGHGTQGRVMVPPGPEAQATAGPCTYICNIEVISERELTCHRPSVCLSVVCLKRPCTRLRRLTFSAMFLCHLVRRPSIDINLKF